MSDVLAGFERGRGRPAPEPLRVRDALAASYQAAASRWPGFSVDADRFAEHLGQLLRDADDPAAAVPRLDGEAIYLTLGCAAGDQRAIGELDRGYLAGVHPALASMKLRTAQIDDVLQVMRSELLLPRERGPLRILGYNGTGSLHGWLRAIAARTALRLEHAGAAKHEVGRDPSAIDAASGSEPEDGDLELAYMKRTYGEAFRTAFQRALAALAVDDRLLLKQRLKHHLGVRELGAMYGVDPGTISRRVAAARDRLAKATRAEMIRDLELGTSEVSSILRLIDSQIDITLSTHDGPP